jgi:cell division septation protein DedD
MGWLRSNWLDALIFLIVAIIMAGVVLFLTGVNPLGFLQSKQTQPVEDPLPGQVGRVQPSQPARPPKERESDTLITVLPLPQAPQSTGSTATPKPVPVPPKLEDPKDEPAATPKPVRYAASNGSWRVAVASFSNAENAARLRETLRAQGYPVNIGRSDGFSRVWVGPYASEARAQEVATSLASYNPRVSGTSGPKATTQSRTQPEPKSTPASEPEPKPQAPETNPTRGGTLQVGAFRSEDSAKNALEAVQKSGYTANVVEENGLFKVRLSISSGLPAAKVALQSQGFAAVEVR